MESPIEEFSLEHIRTNRSRWFTIWRRTSSTEIARCLATDPKLSYLTNLCSVDPVAVEDIQIVAQLKIKNIGILITDHVQETLAINR
jgi:lipopolysaccharide export system ATP-binding protein